MPAAAIADGMALRRTIAPGCPTLFEPVKKTRDRTPTFRFAADEPGSTFQCKLDGRPFKVCASPFTSKRLPLGQHTFKVRARDKSGKLDPTPAACSFKIAGKP